MVSPMRRDTPHEGESIEDQAMAALGRKESLRVSNEGKR